MSTETTHDHDAVHDHGGHAHDEACAAAHGAPVPAAPATRLVLVFDSPVSREMNALGQRLGWQVTVVDPARVGAGSMADLHAVGLDDTCDVVVCDHDRPELGDVLAEALSLPSRWIGIMGSRRHTAPHVAALQQRGFDEATIARVHRPIGLDIGSRTPAEIAVATVAGLLADRNGRSGGPFGA